MTKKILLFLFLFLLAGAANSDENSKISNTVIIEGERQTLEVSDLPLSEYQYDDLSFFSKNFEPQKELLSLLEKPDILMELDNKSLALNFDEKQ